MKPTPKISAALSTAKCLPPRGNVFRKKGDKSRPFLTKLFPDAQLGNHRAVAVDVLLGQVVQEIPALTDHHEEAPAAVVVMLVNPQVLGELVDAGGENGNLDLGRTIL